jgi:hypothetical protein
MPVNATLHRNDEVHPKKCPACEADETQLHWIECTEGKRTDIKQKHSEAINEHMTQTNTPTVVQAALQRCLDFEIGELSNAEHTQATRLYNLQQTIRPHQIYYGRIHREVQIQYQAHTGCTEDRATKWTVDMIEMIWDMTEEIWSQWNIEQHGESHNATTQNKTDEARNKIEKLYQARDTLLNQDQEIYQQDEAEILAQPLHAQLHWIIHAEEFITNQARAATQIVRRSMRRITELFRPNT